MFKPSVGVGALLIAVVSGCGDDAETSSGAGGAGGAASTNDPELPCEVHDFFVTRCGDCHSEPPKFGAPMPLASVEDLQAMALDGKTMVVDAVLARLEADTGRMPPPPNAAATAAEIAIVRDWRDGGMPVRDDDESCGAGGGGGAGGSGVDCTPDVSLSMAQPFEMPASSTDEQVCFGIDVPAAAAKRHITTILPKIDNDTIVHHILLLQAPSSVSPEPTSCGFTAIDWKLLYAWGPGTPPHVLPPEAGFPIDGDETAHFVMQVHYNNLQGLSGQTDQSGIELCTTESLRDNDADIMAFGGMGFNGITPAATSELACETPIVSQVASFFPVTIFQAWPHMHQLGRAMVSEIDHGGSTTMLVDVPDYDFNYQVTYPLEATLDAGDTVRTRCTWQNDTLGEVGFGEDTEDEMCFNFVSYYPRIAIPQWHWLLPAYTATCDMSTL